MLAVARAPVTQSACADALDHLNQLIRNHGGRVEVAEFDEDRQRLTLRFVGFCSSCPAWPMTLHGLIRPYLKEELGLDDVQLADRRVSEAALQRIESAFGAFGRSRA